MTNQNTTQKNDLTAPKRPTHDAAQPPGNPPADEQAVRRSEEELQKPGAGH